MPFVPPMRYQPLKLFMCYTQRDRYLLRARPSFLVLDAFSIVKLGTDVVSASANFDSMSSEVL